MLTRAVGIFAGLFFALALVVFITQKPQTTVRGNFMFDKPMPALALEFAKRGQSLDEVITNAGEWKVRKELLDGLAADGLLIPLYLLLYVGIALVLARRRGAWGVAVAIAAVVCAVGAAASDGAENIAMARLVQRHGAMVAAPEAAARIKELDEKEPDGKGSNEPDIAAPGVRKWALIFVTLALLSLTVFGLGSKSARLAFGLCILTALVGGAGLVVLCRDAEEFRLVQLAGLLMIVTLLPVFLVLTFQRKLFDEPKRP
jgi:hypothetical protein